MSGRFVVKPLTLERIPQAIALVSIFDDGLSENAWSEYAADVVENGGNGLGRGIMTVQSEEGCIYGLSVHDLKQELRRGRILEIENFAAADLAGTRSAARALLKALEELAQRRGCSCISVSLLDPLMRKWLRGPHHPAVDLFKAAEYGGEPMRLRKCI